MPYILMPYAFRGGLLQDLMPYALWRLSLCRMPLDADAAGALCAASASKGMQHPHLKAYGIRI
jgi:hypothetical protein